MTSHRAEPIRAPNLSTAVWRIGVLVLTFAAALAVAFRLGWLDYRHALEHVIALRQSRDLASFSILFVLIYGVVTALGVPGTPLTVAAGVLFGTVKGSLLSWTGGMFSCAVGYWIARTVGRGVVSNWIRRYRRVDRALEEARDFPGMLRLRLLPVLPMGVISFVSGFARAPFVPYLAATAIGLAPTAIIFTYFASALVEGASRGRSNATSAVVVATVLIIGISFAPKLLRSRT